MLCLSHELIHCLRGHLDKDLNSSKSEETDADLMAGNSIWGWIINQPKLLGKYGFSDVEHGAYEMGYASTVLCALFQKYHKSGDGYHLPHQRMLMFNAGYMNLTLQESGKVIASKIWENQENGISGARLMLESNGFGDYVCQLFENKDNQKDYFE